MQAVAQAQAPEHEVPPKIYDGSRQLKLIHEDNLQDLDTRCFETQPFPRDVYLYEATWLVAQVWNLPSRIKSDYDEDC